MALSISYEISCTVEPRGVADLVETWRQRAIEINFEQVGYIADLTFPFGRSERLYSDQESVEAYQRLARRFVFITPPDGAPTLLVVPPLHLVCFAVKLRGAENAAFGLASYPAHIPPASTASSPASVETGLGGGYSWAQSIDTQKAGRIRFGGPRNFLRVHTRIIRMLDAARELGMEVKVQDYGFYWDRRDDDALLKELKKWDLFVEIVEHQAKKKDGGLDGDA